MCHQVSLSTIFQAIIEVCTDCQKTYYFSKMRIFTDFSIGDPVASTTLVSQLPFCRYLLSTWINLLLHYFKEDDYDDNVPGNHSFGNIKSFIPQVFQKKKVIHSLGKIKIDSCQFSIQASFVNVEKLGLDTLTFSSFGMLNVSVCVCVCVCILYKTAFCVLPDSRHCLKVPFYIQKPSNEVTQASSATFLPTLECAIIHKEAFYFSC